MAERTDQRTRDRDTTDVDLGLEDDAGVQTDFGSDLGVDQEPAAESDSGGGIRSRIGKPFGSIFSVEAFGVTLVLTVVMAFLAGGFVPFVPDNIGGLLGVFGAGFALGAASSERHYLEVAAATLLAGAVSAMFTTLLSNLTAFLVGAGVPLIALGAGASGLAGVAGYYFGRDLRAGLSKDI